jgi:hypothetical protein
MTDYVIPCDTFARLASLATADEWFNTVRIENGVALASNKLFMAIERIGGPDGVIHIIADPLLVQQCQTEAQYSSTLTITVIEAMQFATAKTTLGYIHPGNCCKWSGPENDLNDWRKIVANAAEPAAASNGGMVWNARCLAAIIACAPSKCVSFEENIDVSRPALMRDVADPNWVGLFNPWLETGDYPAAVMPEWLK